MLGSTFDPLIEVVTGITITGYRRGIKLIRRSAYGGDECLIPRFTTQKLKLTQCYFSGVKAPFSGLEADFSGISGAKNLFLSDAVHKAFIEVSTFYFFSC